MARNLKEAVRRHREAAEELDKTLRACIAALRERPENVVEGRFRVVAGRERGEGRRMMRKLR